MLEMLEMSDMVSNGEGPQWGSRPPLPPPIKRGREDENEELKKGTFRRQNKTTENKKEPSTFP